MEKKKRFEFLEHRADAYVAAYGENLAEAFENAALAMFEVMTDTKSVKPKFVEAVEVEATDESALLYNWLEDLIIRFDISNRLYSKFEISEIKETNGGLRLKAKIYGEPFDPEKHKQKVGVKAITYHRMKIDKKPGNVRVKFIIDI